MSIMLTSLATVKSFLDIDTDKTTYDSIIVTIIKHVSDRIQTFLNRKLLKEERTQYFQAGRTNYFLDSYPIDSTASLTVVVDETTQTINDDYWVWYDSGTLQFDYATSYIEPKQISITYTGGYAATETSIGVGSTETVLLTVPDSLSYACIMQSAFTFRRRKDVGVSSLSMPDGSVNTMFAADLLPEVRHTLMQHRKLPTDY